MKKKTVRRGNTKPVRSQKAGSKNWLVMVKSWMFVVMFALMLGIGTIIGTYINQQVNMSSPAVAGVQIEAQ